MVVKTMKLDEIIKGVRLDGEEFQGLGTRTLQQLQVTEIKKNQQRRWSNNQKGKKKSR